MVMGMKKTRGRPFKPPRDRRKIILHVRVNAEEKAVLQAKSKKAGKPLSEWARKTLMDSD